MASATGKVHLLRADKRADSEHQFACGMVARAMLARVDVTRPMVHASGRLMTANERKGETARRVTCVTCRKRAGLA